MLRIILFVAFSIPILVLSWRTLSGFHNHGFYRFFAWEGMAWLLASNILYWFDDIFSLHQVISGLLLIGAGILAAVGLVTFMRKGRIDKSRNDDTLFGFEKTTRVIDTGIYRYIRHPLYASLICLTWGFYFKHMTPTLLLISLVSTLFLYISSRMDEKECIAYFGEEYKNYMKRSKMFIPFIF